MVIYPPPKQYVEASWNTFSSPGFSQKDLWTTILYITYAPLPVIKSGALAQDESQASVVHFVIEPRRYDAQFAVWYLYESISCPL